jgi:hypothetical protein
MEAVRYFDAGDGDGTIVYVIPVIGQRTAGMIEQIDAVIRAQTGMDIKVLPSCTARVIERDGEPVTAVKTVQEPVKEKAEEKAEAPAHTAEEQTEEHDGFLDLPCDPDPDARTKELIQMLKEKQAYRERLPEILEEEIEKDPIEAYKKFSKMIRDGETRDPRIIARLTLLYRGKILTNMDSESMAEFFKTFETQLQHEMPQYRAYCERSGETQSRKGLMGFLARKYWDDQAAQAEAKRLMDNEIPDVVRLLMGLDMTSGIPFKE